MNFYYIFVQHVLIKSFSLSDSPALTMVIQVVLKGGRLAAMKFFRTEQDDDGRWEKKEGIESLGKGVGHCCYNSSC